MKLLSAAFILLLTSVSGIALAGDGQPVDANAPYTENQLLSVKSDKEKADDKSAGSIDCACGVPMTYA